MSRLGGLALYNTCVLDWDLDRLFGWAAEQGYAAVELHAGPRFTHVDWRAIAEGRENPLVEAQERYGIPVCGLMYGRLGFLNASPEEPARSLAYLETLLRAAALSGVPVVSTFTGRDPALTLEGNLDAYARIAPRIAELAERYEVDVAFENCPMYEFWPPDHNIAVSPAIWREQFRLVPSARLGLELDPSHLVWQGIDVGHVVEEFADRIRIVQAKDTEVLDGVRRDEGMLTLRWWRHRIPGEGMVDWSSFFSGLRQAGYAGVVSLEHEDPVYGGSEERVLDGLHRSKSHLLESGLCSH